MHRYQKYIRQGQNYYMLATTGGGSKMRGIPYGEFDHITWVTCKKDGPIVSNVLLDGIYNDAMQVGDTDEEGVSTKSRKKVHPCQALVRLDGKPVPNAVVVFYTYAPTTKKYTRVSDGMTDTSGMCAISTYEAFDGVPAGDYTVTVTWQEPRYDPTGKPTPNKLPARYATPAGSPFAVKILPAEKNVIELNLSS